jgi:Ca2+-binding EF-hand superfamily protein
MATPIEKLREACLKRGVCGIKTIGRTFKIIDDNGSRMLDYEELKYGIKDYGLNMSKEELDALFQCFDKDNSGSISFDEFLQALRPPMSRSRLDLIDKAFVKMDATGDGVITIEDLKHYYDVSRHPKFKTGDWTKDRVLKEFLDNFQAGDKDDKVTKEEFVNYYAGVSASIDQDVYFDYMMRQAWKL